MLTAISEFVSLIKNALDIFRKKPEPLSPIQIINVYQPVGIEQKEERRPAPPPIEKRPVLAEGGTPPVVIMPPKKEETQQIEPEFMSDEYLVDLAVELNKKVRPRDRLIFIDNKNAPKDKSNE